MRYPVVIAVGLLLASPAWADFESDKRDCVRGRGQPQVDACSRLLRSGKFNARNRAVAYSNRGIVYRKLKRYRRAIHDYSEALRINPRYAGAYGNRGSAYIRIDQKQLAISDFRMALRLRPGDRIGTAGLKRLGLNR